MKNPFSNLFKKKSKDGQQAPTPTSVEKKKKGFFDNFLKNRLGKQALKVVKVLKVQQVIQALKVLKVMQETKVQKEIQAPQVIKEIQELRVIKVH